MSKMVLFIRIPLVMLLLLLLVNSAEAKKKKPFRLFKPKSTFETDWNNKDSLFIYLYEKYESRDIETALRIADSLLVKVQDTHNRNKVYSLKAAMYVQEGKLKEARQTTVDWHSELLTNGTFNETRDIPLTIAEYYYISESADVGYRILGDQVQRLEDESKAEVEKNKLELAKTEAINSTLDQKVEKLGGQVKLYVMLFWILLAWSVLLIVILIFMMIRHSKMKKQKHKLGEQMDHTRTQIEKAFEESDRIHIEIKRMKEQVARIDAEKKHLRQNVKEATTETLPLLRTQLDALVKENTSLLPVEKFMLLQNTITRLNKQLKEFSE